MSVQKLNLLTEVTQRILHLTCAWFQLMHLSIELFMYLEFCVLIVRHVLCNICFVLWNL